MKKLILSIFALCCMVMSASAIKVYINAGHGGWGSEDRNMPTINYGYGDTLGFWETNTNLWKAFEMETMLKKAGYSTVMSRRANGNDRSLSAIRNEADNSGCDYFISIHSNAGPEGSLTGGSGSFANYPVMLYRGYTGSPTVSKSDQMAKASCKRLYEIFWTTPASSGGTGKDGGPEFTTYYSPTNLDLVGCMSFYGYNLGVLPQYRPGFLAEGYFHTYSPARHRALNPDWCRQEGIRYARGVKDYFGSSGESVGYIMGYVRSKTETYSHKYYIPYKNSNDIYKPINGAKIVLRNSKNEVVKCNCYPYVKRMLKNQSYYTTDHNYNGIFLFEYLTPGTYTLYVHAKGYQDYKTTVTVTADKTIYPEIFMTPGQGTEPNITNEPDIKWVLNGGRIPGGTVPTNEQLWEQFMPYFESYYGVDRAEQTMSNASTFMTKACDIMTNEKSSYKWLGDYIQSVSASQGVVLTNDPTADGMEALWRWSVHCFLNCNKTTTWPYTADFSSAGKPGAWGEKYLVATGTSASLPPSVSSTYTLPTPVKEGYDFVGWFTNSAGTGTALTSITAGWKGTLYAIWKVPDDVKWELHGGYIVGVTLPGRISDAPYTIPTPSRNMHVFLGWYDNEAGTGTPLTVLPVGYKGTVHATWREAQITWVLNGGKVYKDGVEVTLPTSVKSAYTIPTPERDGYDFLGWYDTNDTTGTKYTRLTAGHDGTLYAIWEVAIPTDVKWVLDGGKVDGELPTEITGSPYTIPTPTRTGYVFLGWYENAEGTGTPVTVLPVGYKGKLYAIWREAVVTWVLNGGKVLKEVTTTTPGGTEPVPSQEELWRKFQAAVGLELGTLADIKDAATGNPHNVAETPCACRIICGKLTSDKLKTAFATTEWAWLKTYVMNTQNAQTADGAVALTDDITLAEWRYAVAAFFLQSQHETYPKSANFATAGKPEAWGSEYQKANGSNEPETSTDWVEITLPSKITGSDYTIPTPTKENDIFLGWYDNAEGTGTPLTVLPVGYDGTVYAIWKGTMEADVKWVLNGGKVLKEVTTTVPGTGAKVPTQEELWANYKTAAGLSTLGTLAEITAAGQGQPHNSGDTPCACRIICAKLTATEVQAAFAKTEWAWLKTYIMGVQSDLTDDLTAAAWRYAIAAFFLQSQHSAWPASADFSTAGKPEAWGPAYQAANGGTGEETTTTEWVEVELPTTITAAYTIPTPVKDNDEFIGWYDNNNGTGTALTVLPVGYKGTVYAIWKSMGTSTDVENIRPALDMDAPMYDVLGRQVDATYRGIIIQNGNKYLLR